MGIRGQIKTGGRQKGTPNKQTAGIRDEIEAYLGKSMPLAILETLSELEPKDKAYILLDLMSYVHAKRKALEHSIEMPPEVIDKYEELKHLSDAELKQGLK